MLGKLSRSILGKLVVQSYTHFLMLVQRIRRIYVGPVKSGSDPWRGTQSGGPISACSTESDLSSGSTFHDESEWVNSVEVIVHNIIQGILFRNFELWTIPCVLVFLLILNCAAYFSEQREKFCGCLLDIFLNF